MIALACGGALLGVALLAGWARARQGHPALDLLEALFLTVVGWLIVVVWLGVALASVGRFSLRWIGLSCLAIAAALVVAQRRAAPPRLRAGGPWEVAAFALLLGCAALYLHLGPHEYVLGGADAGTYMNVAATIARTGALIVQDDWVRLLAEHGDASLRPVPSNLLGRSNLFVGWYVDDLEPARVIPQFLPAHPALAAVAIATAGMRAGLLVAPLCAVLGLAAVFLLGRRLLGAPTSLLATVLLAATPTQIFFARYPTAEPLTLLLVFTGLLAWQHLRDGEARSVALGTLGGAAFGLALLTRIDVPPVVVLLGLALAVQWASGGWARGFTALAVSLALLGLHAALHARLLAWPYVWQVFEGPARSLLHLVRRPVAMAAAVAVVIAAVAGVRLALGEPQRRRQRIDGLLRIARCTTTRRLLAALAIALSAYAYFLRPSLEPVRTTLTWPSWNEFPLLDAHNWVRIGWYLTPLGLLLSTLGMAVLLLRAPLERVGLFLAIGGLTTVQYVWRIRNTPYHIYTMRRYVPIVLPTLAILAAAAIAAIARSRRLPLARAWAALLALGLVGGLLWQSRFVLRERDMAGALARLAELESHLAPRAVLLVAEPPTALLADTFGPPLRFLYDHPVVPVRRAEPATVASLLARVFARAAAEGRPVQLVAVEPISPGVRGQLGLWPLTEVGVSLPLLMNTYDSYPSVMQTAHYGIEIYDAQPRLPFDAPPREALIDVGTLDASQIRLGFHPKERIPGDASARWTRGEAQIDLPVTGPGPVEVEIRARVYANEKVPPPEVEVQLDDRPVGRFRVETDWRVFSFTAEAGPMLGRSRLRLVMPTFNPARLGQSGDGRDLGILVDWVRVRPR